mgnify:CR=1 FL=1|tara:strand:- start:8 stop:403 length:396 start_codon:yes stop_codon:yes gene_type:complete
MKGSCLCGSIVYEVEEFASEIMHCACKTCRKAHAAAFNTAAAVETSKFKWLNGEDLLKFYESSPGKYRYFCGNCGSQLIKKIEGRNQIVLRVGTLDDDPKKIPQTFIWASHSVPWLSHETQLKVFSESEIK